MKRFKVIALGMALFLAVFASAPRRAVADDCCTSAAQEVESFCARLGSSVRYFNCVPGCDASTCGWSYDCYPPPQ